MVEYWNTRNGAWMNGHARIKDLTFTALPHNPYFARVDKQGATISLVKDFWVVHIYEFFKNGTEHFLRGQTFKVRDDAFIWAHE